MKAFYSFLKIAPIVILCACLLYACSPADESVTTESETTVVAETFYKLVDENKTLSIELDTDPASGYYWTYEISDEEILALNSFGFTPGSDEEQAAAWSASFAAPSNKVGDVQLKLYSVQADEDVAETDPSYIIDISVSIDGKLTVKSITQ